LVADVPKSYYHGSATSRVQSNLCMFTVVLVWSSNQCARGGLDPKQSPVLERAAQTHIAKQRARAAPPVGDSVLFDDTSSAAPGISSQGFYTSGYNMAGPSNDMQGGPAVNNLFTDPMTNAAMMYGSSLANQGKDIVNKE
ncbi:hypothetical protein ILYODFUR_027096, partial [Ilyodon furcidens]